MIKGSVIRAIVRVQLDLKFNRKCGRDKKVKSKRNQARSATTMDMKVKMKN